METFLMIINVFAVVRMITSAVMCVYGYKWSKGLIATMSIYTGVALGGIVFLIGMKMGAPIDTIIIVPIIASGFSAMAYKNVLLNHFLAGFLLAVKISFMIILKIVEYSRMGSEFTIFVIPVIIGIVAGLLVCVKYNNYILIACAAYIGATEFVPSLFSFLNKTMFVLTEDISFIFDPVSFILSIFGITIPSGGEVFLILLIGGLSFYYQRRMLIQREIDLSGVVVDDRKLKD